MPLNPSELNRIETTIEKLVEWVLERFTQTLERSGCDLEEVIMRNYCGAPRFMGYCDVGKDGLFGLPMDSVDCGMLTHGLVSCLTHERSDSQVHSISFIAIRRAMDRNSQLKDWVRSIIEGAKVCYRIKVATGECRHADYQTQPGLVLEKKLMG